MRKFSTLSGRVLALFPKLTSLTLRRPYADASGEVMPKASGSFGAAITGPQSNRQYADAVIRVCRTLW